MGELSSFKYLLAAVVLVTAGTAFAGLPVYRKTSGVSGNLSVTGSDTLANLMTLWSEDFKRIYPNVNVQVQSAGSSSAPTALTQGTADIGPMSREMKNNELAAFERQHGYQPTAIPVAIDALAIFVNKDNPVRGLTMAQVDGVFSATARCGEHRSITTWGALGLDGLWQHRPLQLYGRNSASGTYGFFRQMALCNGDFKNTVNELHGSASVVLSVSTSLGGIGYSGIGYQSADVKMVPLASRAGQPFVMATWQSAMDGSYPLSRLLYVYVNKQPGQPLPPLEREFLRLILSRQGQEVVVKNGYIPLPAKLVDTCLALLELQPI